MPVATAIGADESAVARSVPIVYVGVVTAQQKILLDEIVWVDPGRMSGEPCFKGTRVPVQTLIDHIEGNSTLDEFLEGFPSVTRKQAVQFIELAKDNLLACVSS